MYLQSKICQYNSLIIIVYMCLQLCSKPEKVCEEMIENIINSLHSKVNNNNNELSGYLIAQCAHILGEVAIKQLNFLDEAVYKELKRRNYIREERKTNKKAGKVNKPVNVQNASSRSRQSKNTTNNTTNQSVNEESTVVSKTLSALTSYNN